jgi:hypothetical protein
MATRFTSSAASGDSDESIIQLEATEPTAIVEIVGRVDASFKWVRLGVLNANLADQQFVRLPKMPFLMASIVRNAGTITLKDTL